MQILKNEYLVLANPEANSKKIIKDTDGNDVELYVDTSWDVIKHAVKFGEIYKVPLGFDENYNHGVELKPGDKVCFHQFVVQPESIINIDDVDYYRAHYQHVWAKIEDGKIYSLDKWTFVEPILIEDNITSDGLIKDPFAKYVKNRGIVNSASEFAQSLGIKEGDKIHFMDGADYPLEIDNKLYYRIRVDSIICIERDGIIVPLSNKVVVVEEKHKKESVIQLLKENADEKYGSVVSIGDDIDDIKIGARVRFAYGIGTLTELDGCEYRVLRKDHIIYEVVAKTDKNILGIRLFA